MLNSKKDNNSNNNNNININNNNDEWWTYKKEEKDEKNFDAIFSDVDIMNDTTSFQSDANFVALSSSGDRLRWRLGVVHVLGHVRIFAEQWLEEKK